MAKYVRDVFPDYEVDNHLIDTEIENVNLYQKTNKLQINLISDKEIKLADIESFEKYLVKRFKVKQARIDVKYSKQTEIEKNIEDEWDNIVNYIAKKEPFSKAILKDSHIAIDAQDLKVKLAMKGADFLFSKKFDKGIEHLLLNLYNEKYKVTFEDEATQNYIEQFKNNIKKQEETIAQKLKEEEDQMEKLESQLAQDKEIEAQIQEEKNSAQREEPEEITPLIVGRSMTIKTPLIKINDISEGIDKVCLDGEVVRFGSLKDIKNDKTIFDFDLYDGSNTITCKAFLKTVDSKKIEKRVHQAKGIKIEGTAGYNQYDKEMQVVVNTIIETSGFKKNKRKDEASEKRVELHMHTKMSQMDGVTSCKDLLKRAVEWGWKSIAITDHGVVQSFPEAHKFLQSTKADLKVLYGVEAYFARDNERSVKNAKGQSIDTEYCVLDLETTGFSPITEKITEVGMMKIKNGEVIDEFECFVNPEKPISQKVTDVTHITDEMVKDAETIDKVIPKMIEFMGDDVLVAHNAKFDMAFLKHNFKKYGYKFNYTYIDTLPLSKLLFPEFKKFKLGILAEKLGIRVDVAHRALDDVKTLVGVFNKILEIGKEEKVELITDFDTKFKVEFKTLNTNHMIILAKNYVGLKNLYKLVSYSHLDYFYKKPRILKSVLDKYREGLIIGSACEAGELYQAIRDGKPEEEIEEIAEYYDYLEVQPLGNNEYLVRTEVVSNREALMDINKRIVELGEKLNKPVVATCDVHFLDPQDEIYRRILQAGQGYDDADMQAPLYLRTTEEMIKEFDYLGYEKAHEIVVKNTNLISDMCEKISPISPEKCPPHIPGCEEEIRNIAYQKAYELYGDPLPEIVQTRLDKELDSIIKNGFSVMYIIAQKLVWKSNEDGYIVGSRGSVGSSFVANMTGITEVNSLKAHYRCPNCKYSDFSDYGVKNGFDLPDKDCPKCGHKLDKDGMDIPFETFLGFNGDKEPDIDLNFSGEYQAKAHKYTEEIFGKGTTFKAGTVSGVQDKTAFGYVKNYYEERHVPISKAEIIRQSNGCLDVKRTTGQHPGGIIVVPKGREIYEFCPVQHPADKADSDIITTHFDYHSIDQNLLKLDILGHDDPTMIRLLQDLTGTDPTKVPLDDKATMSIFSSTDALGVTPEQINSEVGTYGVPEFGTQTSRNILLETKPTTFEELIRLSGLSHGTNVWAGNAQELIQNGTATLSEAICTRDDIMIYLMDKGLPANTAFKIMESVRKGKVAAEKEPKWPEYEQIMREHEVPDWYINSCKKIEYMFPKAHAAAYVTNAFRIAYYKVHDPLAYYAAYFTIRAKAFDSEFMIYGKEKARNKLKEIEMMGKFEATDKDKKMHEDLEIVIEMYERGFRFLDIDLYKSHCTKFKIEDGAIRPPLNSIAGLGDVAAESIYKAAIEEPFECIDDMQSRAKVGKAITELLQKFGCLKGMTQSNQMSLFV